MDHLDERKKRRFLAIARVGDESLHRQWLHPSPFRSFDLYISYYGNNLGPFKNDGEYYSEAKGPRWPIYKEIIDQLGDQIYQYDAVWFPADDISANAYTIDQMFHIFDSLKLWLAQPALTKDSYISWNVTVQKADYIVRYTQFVEIMVPLFSPSALRICSPTFNINFSGWGLDFIWPKLLNYPDQKIAVIDATPVRHTRPVGQGDLVRSQRSSGVNLTRKEQLEQALKQYQIDIPTQYPKGMKALSGLRLTSDRNASDEGINDTHLKEDSSNQIVEHSPVEEIPFPPLTDGAQEVPQLLPLSVLLGRTVGAVYTRLRLYIRR